MTLNTQVAFQVAVYIPRGFNPKLVAHVSVESREVKIPAFETAHNFRVLSENRTITIG
jgi:hypothetical protein